MSRNDLTLKYGSQIVASVMSVMLVIGPAWATDKPEPTIPVYTANYPAFGRLVFDLPKSASYETVAEGDRVLIIFQGASGFNRPLIAPRNVTAILSEGSTATLKLKPGARVKALHVGNRLLIDTFDPDHNRPVPEPLVSGADREAPAPNRSRPRLSTDTPLAKPSDPTPGTPELSRDRTSIAPASRPEEKLPARITGMPGSGLGKTVVPPDDKLETSNIPELPLGLAQTPKQNAVSPVEPPAPVIVPSASVEVVERATPSDLPAPAEGPASPIPVPFILAADSSVGAAAFRREGMGIVVLDRRLSLAVPAEIHGAVVTQGAITTMLQVPLPPRAALKLTRVPAGWTVGIADAGPIPSMPIQSVPDGAAFSLVHAGRAVTVLDPLTGGTLLVGTSLAGGADMAGVTERHTPEYTVLPTWLGVVIEPTSDQADLRGSPNGFVLYGTGPAPELALETPAGRHFDFPNEPAPALLNRLRAQLASAAAAPPRARSSARLAAAQAMLALGMGAEAQALVQTIAADDPQAAADANVSAMAAVAAVLAGRLDEANALDDPRLESSPEILAWRGLRDRRMGRETDAARGLPSAVALALGYPRPLRRLIWPDIAEAAVEAGVAVPAGKLTPFANAMLLERSNKLDEAAAAWQAIADGPDRLDQMRATVRGAELNLASGRKGPGETADVLERQMFAWRGDSRELAVRLRAAELRAAAGGWRAALDLLRATDPLFPEQKENIQKRKGAVFEGMLAAEGGKLSPLDVVMLATDYADCIPDGSSGAGLAALLADKLIALDLPARAIPVLQGLVKATAPGPARAELGARLAQLLLEGGDPSATVATLLASAAPGSTARLIEARGLLMARALAAQGNLADAVSRLQALGSAAADDARAALLAKAGDWAGSLSALSDLAAKVVPTDGPMSEEGKSVLMREASAAAQVPDPVTMRALERQIPRMTGANADLLRVLTQAPVTSASELPRAARELTLARVIPQRLQQLGPR